jgi:hypothetical protein
MCIALAAGTDFFGAANYVCSFFFFFFFFEMQIVMID